MYGVRLVLGMEVILVVGMDSTDLRDMVVMQLRYGFLLILLALLLQPEGVEEEATRTAQMA